MADNKTKQSAANVEAYLTSIEDPSRRQDCEALVRLFKQAVGESPRMWGTAIVGFGTRAYRYDSGRAGETCRVGFASRKGDISLYGLNTSPEVGALLAKLGKHKQGKGCIYIKRLSDIDAGVLAQLAATTLA
jgi:hypothetical protein